VTEEAAELADYLPLSFKSPKKPESASAPAPLPRFKIMQSSNYFRLDSGFRRNDGHWILASQSNAPNSLWLPTHESSKAAVTNEPSAAQITCLRRQRPKPGCYITAQPAQR
jgi:hypothetical protein